MIILIDSRERSSLFFEHPTITEIRTQKLVVGDYTVILDDGYQVPTIFERKSIPDLFGSLSRDYPRFKKEIIRAKEAGITLILIIEGSFFKVLAGYERSKVSGISIIKTIFSLWVRYGVVPIFCKDRTEVQEFIIQYYLAENRKRKEKP